MNHFKALLACTIVSMSLLGSTIAAHAFCPDPIGDAGAAQDGPTFDISFIDATIDGSNVYISVGFGGVSPTPELARNQVNSLLNGSIHITTDKASFDIAWSSADMHNWSPGDLSGFLTLSPPIVGGPAVPVTIIQKNR